MTAQPQPQPPSSGGALLAPRPSSEPGTGQREQGACVLVPYDGSPGVQRALLRAAPLLAGHRALVVTLWWSVKPMSGMAHAALPS